MMKSNTKSSKVTKKIKDYKMKDWLFLLQVFALIIAIGTFIYTYLVVRKYKFLSDFAISILLFTLAINNHKIYKRKNFTIIYICFAVFFIITGIWGIFNG